MSDFAPSAFPPEQPRRELPEVHAFAAPHGAAVAGAPPGAAAAYDRGFRHENRRSLDNRRFWAYLLDSLVIGACLLAFGAAVGFGPWYYFVYPALYFTYFFVLETLSGQTIGKRAMKLRVMHIGGGPAGTMAIGARTVLRLIDGHIGVFAMILSGGRRQRIGDLAARTVVRRDDRPYTPAPRSVMLPLYPIMWIGAALLISLQLGLFGTQDSATDSALTSDPYMRKINDICKRRLEAEAAMGEQATPEEAIRPAELEFGAIASLPKPPQRSRAAYRKVMRIERSGVRRAHRIIALISAGNQDRLRKELKSLDTFLKRASKRFAKLGLPHCAQ